MEKRRWKRSWHPCPASTATIKLFLCQPESLLKKDDDLILQAPAVFFGLGYERRMKAQRQSQAEVFNRFFLLDFCHPYSIDKVMSLSQAHNGPLTGRAKIIRLITHL